MKIVNIFLKYLPIYGNQRKLSMKHVKKLILLIIVLGISCIGGKKLSIEKMLDYAGLKQLPEHEDYQETGAVILYEDTKTKFFFDANWNLQRSQTYHLVLRYFNDKAKKWLTRTIYLDEDHYLINFYARTIRPDGSYLELSKKDLFSTQIKSDVNEFTNNQSKEFTFSGVEPGVLLEYSYEIKMYEKFSLYDQWYIQNSLPKLYTKYSIQFPTFLLNNNINWIYSPVNIEIDPPQKIITQHPQYLQKDQSNIYYWELKNVPSLIYEPNMPPYDDVAQYVILGFPEKSWNELSKIYWRAIKNRIFPKNQAELKTLANTIVGSSNDDFSKIQKIFYHTQRNYRYVAVDINDSGYIPNFPEEIIKRKYGDCKDMTIMIVVLLKSLGIEASPALVKTKDAGILQPDIVQMDFNHMIAYVKDRKGKEYWLDATGSSCPINEIYPSIEGANALVIRDDGSSFFRQLPTSSSQDNFLLRTITLNIENNGSVHGHAKLELAGNENLSFRSSLKDATEKDMFNVIAGYVNINTPDIIISNLKYDNPGAIRDKTNIEFDFFHQNYSSITDNLAIVNPNIFSLDSDLDLFKNTKRKSPIIFPAPFEIIDKVNINFSKKLFRFESTDASFSKNYSFGSLDLNSNQNGDENIYFERKYKLSKTKINPEFYMEYRDFLKDINRSNRLNLVLKKVEF